MPDPTPITEPLLCPDCAGQGCRWCSQSGRWPAPTVGAARSTARVLRTASQDETGPAADRHRFLAALYLAAADKASRAKPN